jgi:hypothetical protein
MLLQGMTGAPLIAPVLGGTGIAVSMGVLLLAFLRSLESRSIRAS